jgi:hypothetical protein
LDGIWRAGGGWPVNGKKLPPNLLLHLLTGIVKIVSCPESHARRQLRQIYSAARRAATI